jgi:hypothetical protein
MPLFAAHRRIVVLVRHEDKTTEFVLTTTPVDLFRSLCLFVGFWGQRFLCPYFHPF